MLYSYGYFSDEENLQNGESQFQILSDHLPLILQHERDILTCADYFFCPLDFAYCSWSWVGGDGPLYHSGKAAVAKMPNVSLLKHDMKLKFSRKP